jgi:proline racemase
VIADAAQFGLQLRSDNTAPAIGAARSLLDAANETVHAEHPVDKLVKGVTHVQFFSTEQYEGADARIMVIIEPGIVDRWPCGTGTTAKVATLMERGQMNVGDTFTYESVTGGRFTGTALETTASGEIKGYRVSITGRAYITAESTIIVDSRDPLRHGFLVN